MPSAGGRPCEVAMIDYEEFWSVLPDRALHPLRVPILEALRWIGEPLSAIALVDVIDGHITMWEAAHHLRVLNALGIAEPSPVDAEAGASRNDIFDVPYHLKDRNSGEGP
jgi:hypothetical protein